MRNLDNYSPKGDQVKEDRRMQAIDEAKNSYGCFTLISKDIEDLEIHRNRNLIEKTFGALRKGRTCTRASCL